jgi:hypothetical protein
VLSISRLPHFSERPDQRRSDLTYSAATFTRLAEISSLLVAIPDKSPIRKEYTYPARKASFAGYAVTIRIRLA